MIHHFLRNEHQIAIVRLLLNCLLVNFDESFDRRLFVGFHDHVGLYLMVAGWVEISVATTD